MLTGTADGLSTALTGLNLLALLVLGLVTVPSLMVSWEAPFGPAVGTGWTAPGWEATALVSAGLVLAGLAVGTAYLVLIVRQMEGDAAGRPLLRETWWGLVRLVRTVLVLVVGLVSLAVPLSLVLALVSRVSPGMGAMGVMVFSGALLALWFYLFFTVDAVILNRVGPLRAIYYSFSVVRLHVWRVVGLVLVINVILAGLGIVWRALGSLHPLATVAAIAAHALVGTAMAATSLVFYRDRYLRWQASAGAPDRED